MGSQNTKNDEAPVHTVVVDAFYLDAYLVTNGLLQRCVDAGGCSQPGKKFRDL